MLQADTGALLDSAGEVEAAAGTLADLDVATPFADIFIRGISKRTP